MRISDWSSDVCSSDLTHGEIVGRGHDRPPVYIRAPEDEIARRQILQRAIGTIGPPPRDLADLAKAARIDDRIEPRPRVHLAPAVLARDLLGPDRQSTRLNSSH